jgi:hypothetical protein
MEQVKIECEAKIPTWLDVERNQGYGPRRIPDSRDDDVSSLLRRWMTLDPHARQELSSSITDRQRPTLLAYCERMAARAVRESSREWIVLGLVAQGIDGWRADWRENALLLCLHYDACSRIGVSAEGVFSELAGLLPLNVSHAMASFLKRNAEDKTLEAMGYEASSDQDGFRYRRNW